jgi:hypothetical protein
MLRQYVLVSSLLVGPKIIFYYCQLRVYVGRHL